MSVLRTNGPLVWMIQSRVATVREKVWKMIFFLGQGKVREFEFESGKIAKSEKVREFQNFLKRDGLWQCISVLKEFEKSKFFSPKVTWLSVSQNFLINLKFEVFKQIV